MIEEAHMILAECLAAMAGKPEPDDAHIREAGELLERVRFRKWDLRQDEEEVG